MPDERQVPRFTVKPEEGGSRTVPAKPAAEADTAPVSPDKDTPALAPDKKERR